jgi:hypothetical protein
MENSILTGDRISRGFVLEVVGIEVVDPAVAGFCLRVHKEPDRRPSRTGQGNIVREMIRHPIHFPRPKRQAPRGFYHLIVKWAVAEGSSRTTFRASAGSTGTQP